MKQSRRRFLKLATAATAVPAASRIAKAQTWPSRPIRWIVGFPPGGGADQVARIMGSWLSDRLGQSVFIENRPGASTHIAVQAVVSSPPDGYTLLFLGASAVVGAAMFPNLQFALQRDIAPVAGLIDYPMVLVAHPSFPAKTIPELIALAKASPGKITMASFGTGSASHVAGELFKMMANIDLTHVPYRGGAPMIADLVGGQVNVGFDVMATTLPHIRTGKLRALANAGATRYEALADVPTIGETVAGYEASTWAGIGVTRGTPAEAIERLNREVNAGLKNEAIRAKLVQAGTIPMIVTPAAFGAHIAAETVKWTKVVKVAGIKPD